MKNRNIPWDKMRQEYIFTSATIRSLAAKYGCSKRAVDRRSATEGWVVLRKNEMTSVGQEAHARIREEAVQDRIRVYDATREAVDHIVQSVLKAAQDADSLFRHLVKFEHTAYDSSTGERVTERKTEDRVFKIINGRNLADIARALNDIMGLVRILDGILDANDQAKLDLERDKFELDRWRSGMGDDNMNECGVAIVPAIDKSLLDGALPDPDQ